MGKGSICPAVSAYTGHRSPYTWNVISLARADPAEWCREALGTYYSQREALPDCTCAEAEKVAQRM